MAMEKARCGKNIWFQVAIVVVNFLLLVIDGVASNPNLLETKMRRIVKPLKKPAATIKTIKEQNGDVIDCVDMYKQPAFDHPALKNHTIQMRPGDGTGVTASNSSSSATSFAQLWRVNGRCPEGTIPILRPRKNNFLIENSPNMAPVTEVAKMALGPGTYYGASGHLNIWNGQHIESGEDCASSIAIGRREGNVDKHVAAGWTVSEILYGDKEARLTTYWLLADGSNETDCYNLNCAGFVQTNPHVYLGSTFDATSVYGGKQVEILINIVLDPNSKNWWLNYFDEPVGYWPASIFKDLNSANVINWGGDVGLMKGGAARHSTTEMGNGHYPNEGYRKSAYVSSALYVGEDYKYHQPHGAGALRPKPACYDVVDYGMGQFGRHGLTFYFGGNGQVQGCQK